MNNGDIMRQRLHNQISDYDNKSTTYRLLKSDLQRFFADYTDSSADEIDLNVSIDNNGLYVIRIIVTAKTFKEAGYILPD